MQNEIKHDKENHRFFTIIEGHEAFIQYKPAEENQMDVYKTYVPDELRGQSVAADLAESVLDFAEKESLEIIPTCSYVQKYISRK
ncbi:MAG: N-acetyltransferase [bacterium]|nr:N-acetyltransferase [bacterium]